MIIACPSCSTRFSVNTAAFPANGRKVRCARCTHVWHVNPNEKAPAPSPVVARAPAPVTGPAAEADIAAILAPASVTASSRPPETTPEMIWAGSDIPRRRPRRTATYAMAAAVVATVLGGLIVFREPIAKTVPAMGDLYAALGFHIDTTGLDLSIQAKAMEASETEGVMTLIVTGTIANVTAEDRPVPRIQAFLLAKDHRELHAWEFDPGVDRLKPGERYDFRQVLAKPPSETYQVYAHFLGHGG